MGIRRVRSGKASSSDFGSPCDSLPKTRIVARFESRLGVKPSRRLREEPRLARRQARDESGPIIDGFPHEALPIVEPCPAKIVIVYAKAERPDEPEFRSDRDARSPDAPRVVGDFRLMQNDVQAGIVAHRF